MVGVAAAAAGVLFPGRPRFFCVSPWVGVLVAGVPEGVDSFVSCEGVLGADCPSKRKQLNTFKTNSKAWNKSKFFHLENRFPISFSNIYRRYYYMKNTDFTCYSLLILDQTW